MWDDQLSRLTRPECMQDLPTFIEELVSIFRSQDLIHAGNLTIIQPDGTTQEPITVQNFDPLNDVVNLIGRHGTALAPLTYATSSGEGEPQQGSASACYPGYITGHVGGNVYEVTIYQNGLSGASQTVNVTQLQIASGATIRADGTVGVLVSKTDNGQYYMQVPVFQRAAS